jgi:Xaa-Pro dipeptidase
MAEGFARTGALSRAIIREVIDWELLTTRVLLATWAAPQSARPHSIPDLNDRLCEGAHVALSFLRVNGYAAESERTFFTARPSPESRRAFQAMQEARALAFRMIRPGVACGELDAAINEFLRAKGYAGEDCRLHRTGHGIGLGNHEAPWVAKGSADVLAENMVISIEPGIYLKGQGGFRHSDTVLVTRDDPECLTRYCSDIESLTILAWKPMTRLKAVLIERAMGLKEKAALASTAVE